MVKKKEYTDTTEKNNNRLNDFEINLKYQNTLIDTKFDKKCKDISDLISLNDKKHKELLSDMKICVDKIINDHDVESEYIDKKINYKLEIFKTTLDDFKKKLIEKVDLDEEKLKNENKKDNFHILQTISVKLDEKLAVMKKDLSVEKDDYMKILEGKLHGLIIELEKRTDENVNFKLMNLEERLIKT